MGGLPGFVVWVRNKRAHEKRKDIKKILKGDIKKEVEKRVENRRVKKEAQQDSINRRSRLYWNGSLWRANPFSNDAAFRADAKLYDEMIEKFKLRERDIKREKLSKSKRIKKIHLVMNRKVPADLTLHLRKFIH